jgi:uncharacterized secreted protein with C-terminal beta-propeller domain
MALVAYSSCDAMLAQLRSHTAAHVSAYGLGDYPPYAYGQVDVRGPALGPVAGAKGLGGAAAAPEHSTTNVQEAGVGEPDIVETDGRRVASVSGGVLRVVDAATHEIDGTLDLSMYAGADSAQLLMSGDRVLVILGDAVRPVYYYDALYPIGNSGGSTLLLVDVTAGRPTITSTLHTGGQYLDARMVGGTARIVVQSRPHLVFPQPRGRHSAEQRVAGNREIVRHAPLRAWLPSYQVTAAGRTSTESVPCEDVSHPVNYTGTSMLTVYTVDLAASLADPRPITLAADGTTVYASGTSLYVADANGPEGHGVKTQLHRFDITTAGRPAYLGSGAVPGQLLDSYSMSEYDGTLRVVTTEDQWSGTASTGLYALNANTLRILGHVGGLGLGEQVHAVRFLGALGYVVTFRSVDPLYVLDLHDPKRPRQVAALKISGYSDYLHPVADGRLLGVGEDVTPGGMVNGLQVSLFDVASPAHPARLDRLVQRHSASETAIDPHAFLYWPARKLAVIPINAWDARESGAALVVHVGSDDLSVVGTIRNPAVSSIDSYDTGIERTLVIGDQLWTMSSSGLRVSDLGSLDRIAWVPFE